MLRALSIRQPWAWAVAAGHKQIENRTRSVSYRGPLAIHAARILATRDAFERCAALAGTPIPDNLATGAVIAVCQLFEVVTASHDPWFTGPHGFVLIDVVPIPPVPCRGFITLFELPHEVESAVREHVRHRLQAH